MAWITGAAIPLPAQTRSSDTVSSYPRDYPSPSRREGVKTLQRALRQVGEFPREPDGRWDSATREGIRNFQKKAGLRANGKIHQATWDALRKAIQKQQETRTSTPVAPAEIVPAPEPATVSTEPVTPAAEPETVLSPLPEQRIAPLTDMEPPSDSLLAVNLPTSAPLAQEEEDLVLPPRPRTTAIGNLPRLLGDAVQGQSDFASDQSSIVTYAEAALETGRSNTLRPVMEQPAAPSSAILLPPDTPIYPQNTQPAVRLASAQDSPSQSLPPPDPISSRALSLSVLELPVTSEPDTTPAPDMAVVEATTQPLAVVTPIPYTEPVLAKSTAPAATLVVPAIRIPAPPPARDPKLEAARLAEMARLRTEATALVDQLAADPRYEVSKLAPENLNQARAYADRISNELRNPSAAALTSARTTMQLLQQEIARAMEVASRQKASRSVEEISAIHKRLRTRWSSSVRRGSLADDMAAADKGYEVLMTDYKAGRFEPIAAKSDGFLIVLQRIEQAAARNWIESMLMDAGVRRQIQEADVKRISLLQAQGQHVQAADLLQSLAGSATNNAKVEAPKATPTPKPTARRSSSSRSSRRSSSAQRNRRVIIEDAGSSRSSRRR